MALYRAENGNEAGCEGARREADKFASDMRDFVAPLIREGFSDAAIAAALNEEGIETRRGAHWHENSVRRLRDRLAI
ncbi:MAG: recombinase family protein [Alphaproteobacteria bacterium]|nr:recombinase family protein [Alphaproteobacteria bacterium]